MLASEVLLRARDSLSDPDKDRYSDPLLLRLLSEGLASICLDNKLLQVETQLYPLSGIREYNLPVDVDTLLGAYYKGEDLHFTAWSTLTDGDKTWQSRTGDVESIVYDTRTYDYIRLYPLPDDSVVQSKYVFISEAVTAEFSSTYGVITGLEDGTVSSYGVTTGFVEINIDPENGVVYELGTIEPVYGIATSLEGSSYNVLAINYPFGITVDISDSTLANLYGVVTSSTKVDDELMDDYGIVVDWQEPIEAITLQYSKLPEEITHLDQILPLGQGYKRLLALYIVWKAYSDDLDTAYLEKSKSAGREYLAEEQKILVRRSKDYTVNNAHSHGYVGAFSR